MTEAREDQFEVKRNSVVHRPTNSVFLAYRGRAECYQANWPNDNSALPDGFNCKDVLRVATKLLARRSSLIN
jgi:hypothetical protein